MIVRQTYRCENEWIVIRFYFDETTKIITELKEIDMNEEVKYNELTMPTIQVTGECFRRIINNKKLS